MSSEKTVEECQKDAKILLQHFDTNKDGKLCPEELQEIAARYGRGEVPKEVLQVLVKYDTDFDGQLDAQELSKLQHDTYRAGARYGAYVGAMARYLAFTSDFGEAFRPIAPPWLVSASYAVAGAYCVGDVAYEAYQARQQGVAGGQLADRILERSVFHALASLLLPAVLIHTQVRVFSGVCQRLGRWQKWGPTVAGFALVPFFPVALDHPVEHAAANFVHNYVHPYTSRFDDSHSD